MVFLNLLVVALFLFTDAKKKNKKATNGHKEVVKPVKALRREAVPPEGFNRTVYMLWLQGFDHAPEVVRECRKSWLHYNAHSWNFVFLDNTTLPHYLPSSLLHRLMPNRATMSPNHVSNIIRLLLLEIYGGLWADATLFCTRPLDDWLIPNIQEGFFAFAKPTANRMLSNWFLYGSRQNYIVRKWLNATVTYHATHPVDDVYFIQHQLFGDLFRSDSLFRSMWKRVPPVSAKHEGPHMLMEEGYFEQLSPQVKTQIDSHSSPLYKLTWKEYVFNRTGHTTNIDYLYSTVADSPAPQFQNWRFPSGGDAKKPSPKAPAASIRDSKTPSKEKQAKGKSMRSPAVSASKKKGSDSASTKKRPENTRSSDKAASKRSYKRKPATKGH